MPLLVIVMMIIVTIILVIVIIFICTFTGIPSALCKAMQKDWDPFAGAPARQLPEWIKIYKTILYNV